MSKKFIHFLWYSIDFKYHEVNRKITSSKIKFEYKHADKLSKANARLHMSR